MAFNILDNDTRDFLNHIYGTLGFQETFIYLFSNAKRPVVECVLNKRVFINKLRISKYFKCRQKIKCSICLENVNKKEFVRKLDCMHEFHKKCIDNWMYILYKAGDVINCPLCRKTVVFNEIIGV